MPTTTPPSTSRTATDRQFTLKSEIGAASLFLFVSSLAFIVYVDLLWEALPVPHYYIEMLETDLEGIIDVFILALIPSLCHVILSYYRGGYTAGSRSVFLPLIYIPLLLGTTFLPGISLLGFPFLAYLASAAIYYLPARVR